MPTYTLTADQVLDLRGDLGLKGLTDQESNKVFTDEELNRLYNRAGGDYDTTVVYGFRQILADTVKYHVYLTGQPEGDKDQTFRNLQAMLDMWKLAAGITGDEGLGTLRVGTISLGLNTPEGDQWSS
jgi:hypothetical protein